jgi:HAD superfamily hydrolase (TIGR01509 family)
VATRAIVFDFDGVVLDSEEPDFLAWQQIWAEAGQELPLLEWSECIGTGQGHSTFDPYTELVRRSGLPRTEAEVRGRMRAVSAEIMASRPAMAGVADWLEEAASAGLAVGIASSSPRSWIEPQLARLGLSGHFPVISCYDDCGVRKPEPASYQLACRTLGVEPAEALAVEDSRNGLLAAKAAGLWCLVVPNVMTAHMDFSEADIVLGSLAEAGPLAVVERLGGLR